MRPVRAPFALAGAATGVAGLAVSHLLVGLLELRAGPVVAVGERIIVLTPGSTAEALIQAVGQWDKPLLIIGVLLGLLAFTVAAGVLARRHLLAGYAVLAVLTAIGLAAVSAEGASGGLDAVPVVGGALTWFVLLPVLVRAAGRAAGPGTGRSPAAASVDEGTGGAVPASGRGRRGFFKLVGAVGVGAAVVAVAGEVVARSRQAAEAARRALDLPVTDGVVPDGATVDLAGMPPWRTPNEEFYRIDTALAVPQVEVADWRLRIHGLVERELEITYDDLLDRGLTDSWVTLCCVSNEVGGALVGNAHWSGVPVAGLLEEAGVLPGANAVRQTSVDGWDCATPLLALAEPNALLAVAMNGEPLPLEHGFPVRMVVPGLYGYVSATKWVVDLEVTRFEDVEAYWTLRGWGEEGPVRTQSRIDVPRVGARVDPGLVGVGGTAWAQDTGIAYVEYRLDGGPWEEAELGRVPSDDTWVQWKGTVTVEPGDHVLTVRATDRSGYTQTSVQRPVVPDGATGWHSVPIAAS